MAFSLRKKVKVKFNRVYYNSASSFTTQMRKSLIIRSSNNELSDTNLSINKTIGEFVTLLLLKLKMVIILIQGHHKNVSKCIVKWSTTRPAARSKIVTEWKLTKLIWVRILVRCRRKMCNNPVDFSSLWKAQVSKRNMNTFCLGGNSSFCWTNSVIYVKWWETNNTRTSMQLWELPR